MSGYISTSTVSLSLPLLPLSPSPLRVPLPLAFPALLLLPLLLLPFVLPFAFALAAAAVLAFFIARAILGSINESRFHIIFMLSLQISTPFHLPFKRGCSFSSSGGKNSCTATRCPCTAPNLFAVSARVSFPSHAELRVSLSTVIFFVSGETLSWSLR